MAEIFKKIGQKELTRQGLQELYNFKKQNPDANLAPFLDKSSQYFRDYIERGLAGIEKDLSNGGGSVSSGLGSSNGGGLVGMSSDSASNGSSSSAVPPHRQYLERLKRLREQGGLESAGGGGGGGGQVTSTTTSAYRISATSSVVSTASSNRIDYNEPPQDASAPNAANMEDIRRRLERIRQSAT